MINQTNKLKKAILNNKSDSANTMHIPETVNNYVRLDYNLEYSSLTQLINGFNTVIPIKTGQVGDKIKLNFNTGTNGKCKY